MARASYRGQGCRRDARRFPDNAPLVRATDVPTYVEHGGAEIEGDRENARARGNRGTNHCRPLLRAGADRGRVEELILHVVIAVRWIARVGQLALIGEGSRLCPAGTRTAREQTDCGAEEECRSPISMVHASLPVSVVGVPARHCVTGRRVSLGAKTA